MGLLKKLWKGVKKVVKKIGKGIKKVVGKIGAAIGKLGIVGQIGMMFLMPYAMAGLSSFFGGVGAKIATWSANLATSNPIVSKFLGAVHKAGSMAANAYNTVTTAIGNGVDRVGNFFKGEGFTLSGDRTSVFGGVSSSDIPVPELTGDGITINKDGTVNFDTSPNDFGASKDFSTGGAGTVDVGSFEGALNIDAPSTFTATEFNTDGTLKLLDSTNDFGASRVTASTFEEALQGTQTFAEQAANLSTDYTLPELESLLTPDAKLAKGLPTGLSSEGSQTFGEYLTDLPGKIKGGIKDAFAEPGQLASQTIQSGLVSGGAQRIAYSVMGDPPVQRQHVTTQNLSQELYNNPTGVYNSVDVSLTQQGAPWGAGNLAHYGYMQEGLSDGSDEYARLMQRIV